MKLNYIYYIRIKLATILKYMLHKIKIKVKIATFITLYEIKIIFTTSEQNLLHFSTLYKIRIIFTKSE
jgi:hypothetical protein